MFNKQRLDKYAGSPADIPAQEDRGLLAQSSLEFTFGMVIVVLLIVGMIRVFAWTGRDLVDRRKDHDARLRTSTCSEARCPFQQIRPIFSKPSQIGAVWSSNIYGTN